MPQPPHNPLSPGSRQSGPMTIERLRIREKQDEPENVRNHRGEEDDPEAARAEDERPSDQRCDRRAKLRRCPCLSVVGDLLVLQSVQAEMLEDHRLVGAGAECLSEGKQNHRDRVDPELRDGVEQSERCQVRRERGEHRFAPPDGVGHDARGDLENVRADLADRVQDADLQEGQSHLAEEQNQERIEEPKVLQEPVEPELPVHRVSGEWHRTECTASGKRRTRTQILSLASKGNQSVIEHRFEVVNSYGSESVAIGQAGFRGYIIFGFPHKNLYVCESIYFGNATYVFEEDWEELSKRTKAEILNENLQKDRLIHIKGWEQKVHNLLSP